MDVVIAHKATITYPSPNIGNGSFSGRSGLLPMLITDRCVPDLADSTQKKQRQQLKMTH
ncbi:MAG: hypothetical protein JJD98_21180 [Polaromonas sp.]|nr:hypothetical protein [Polaromonas sp.]